MVKTALNNHLLRADSSSATFTEVKTSKQIRDFGQKYLSSPGPRTSTKERVFLDLLPETVLRSENRVP